jgi:transcriptional regulator with XRE-family HTH domain
MPFYENYIFLCNKVGKSPSSVAVEIGLAKPAVTRWKNGGQPTDSTVAKLATYFGVTTDYLLGKENKKAPTDSGERQVNHEDIKFALFGGADEITDAMYEEVRNFAEFVKQREAEKRKG